MERTGLHLLFIVLLCAVSTDIRSGIDVFTCEPEWAALVSEVGGEHVNASSATTALQDVHHIQARPGHDDFSPDESRLARRHRRLEVSFQFLEVGDRLADLTV